jgi:hypothetical protein
MRDHQDCDEDKDESDYIHDVPLGIATIEDMSHEIGSRDRAHVFLCWSDDGQNLVYSNLDPKSLHRVVANLTRAFEVGHVDVRLSRSSPRGQSLAVAAVVALSVITFVAAAVYFFAAVK